MEGDDDLRAVVSDCHKVEIKPSPSNICTTQSSSQGNEMRASVIEGLAEQQLLKGRLLGIGGKECDNGVVLHAVVPLRRQGSTMSTNRE